jgi:hypothetical protein
MTPVLASYWFFKRTDMTSLVYAMGGRSSVDLFIDSGAFSAWSSGHEVNIRDYAAWLLEHRSVINFAAGLDVIGDPTATIRNLKSLLDLVGDQVKIVPTFHVGTPWKALDALVEGFDFIALGGVVSLRLRDHDPLMPWLVTAHRVMREAGVVAHGFGITKPPLPHVLPWYSVDSAYWQQAAISGGFTLWDTRSTSMRRVVAGKRTGIRGKELIREYGGDPETFSRPGFGLVGKSDDPNRARREREWLQVASAASWYRYARHIRTVFTTAAPEDVDGIGPKIYLASGSKDDIKLLNEANTLAEGLGI